MVFSQKFMAATLLASVTAVTPILYVTNSAMADVRSHQSSGKTRMLMRGAALDAANAVVTQDAGAATDSVASPTSTMNNVSAVTTAVVTPTVGETTRPALIHQPRPVHVTSLPGTVRPRPVHVMTLPGTVPPRPIHVTTLPATVPQVQPKPTQWLRQTPRPQFDPRLMPVTTLPGREHHFQTWPPHVMPPWQRPQFTPLPMPVYGWRHRPLVNPMPMPAYGWRHRPLVNPMPMPLPMPRRGWRHNQLEVSPPIEMTPLPVYNADSRVNNYAGSVSFGNGELNSTRLPDPRNAYRIGYNFGWRGAAADPLWSSNMSYQMGYAKGFAVWQSNHSPAPY